MNRGTYSESSVLHEILRGKRIDRPVLLVVAHPDDESVGAASRLALMPEAHILLMTDGAPVDPVTRNRQSPQRLAYRDQRRREFRSAMRLVGLHSSFSSLDIIDQQSHRHLPELVEHCLWLLRALKPALVLTHPYEGGHPDHDSAAFVVSTALQLLARTRPKGSEEPLPEVAEMAFYSRTQEHGKRVELKGPKNRGNDPSTSSKRPGVDKQPKSTGRADTSFSIGATGSTRSSQSARSTDSTPSTGLTRPTGSSRSTGETEARPQDDEMLVGEFRHGSAGITLRLSEEEQALRSALLEAYPSQRGILSLFSRKIECFRPAPSYNFSLPPHAGRPLYEYKDWGNYEEWQKAVHGYLRDFELAGPAALRGRQ